MFVSENTLFKNIGFLEILQSVFEQTLMWFISSVTSNANQGENKQTKTPKIHFILAQLALKENVTIDSDHNSSYNLIFQFECSYLPFFDQLDHMCVCVCIIYNIYIYYILIDSCSFLTPILALIKGTQTLLFDKVQWVFTSFHGLFPFIHSFTCPNFFCKLPRVWLIYFCLVWLLVFSCSLIWEHAME